MTTQVILTATEGALKPREFVFTAQEAQMLIGRSRACTLRLNDDTVSRRHCLVAIDEAGVWVGDLGSLNGTFVNGRLVGQRACNRGDDTPAPLALRKLQDGDELRVGGQAFQITVMAAGPPEHGSGCEVVQRQGGGVVFDSPGEPQ